MKLSRWFRRVAGVAIVLLLLLFERHTAKLGAEGGISNHKDVLPINKLLPERSQPPSLFSNPII